jgi:hypothetical protein
MSIEPQLSIDGTAFLPHWSARFMSFGAARPKERDWPCRATREDATTTLTNTDGEWRLNANLPTLGFTRRASLAGRHSF